ncbi:hypothetical protein KHA94_09305 [Bacillus sp. FJAT-49705]|uniref:Uncharacterized protein n=1 Tax=Cytobacillus citreus TaxID=2833586 RepID=A0ABS5NRE8_9BACI|nr:hypothetical protein [Cytobacillus citreus]MBS4190395.1 hypothetical protein [Cytobacillus citreus]
MTKTKWALILLGVLDLMLIIMYLTDYFILFLKPSGYLIPLAINIIVLSVIGFRSSRYHNLWTIAGLVLSIPILLIHGFMVWLMDYSYTTIDSTYNQQSLVIEYRDITLGETTYFYDFYKTTFGIVGKRLDDQSIEMVIQGTDRPAGLDAEVALGLGGEKWITKDIVRFPTWEGMKEVHLKPSSVRAADIEAFIEMAKNKESGQTITVNGNQLEIRYDELSGQSWIEVSSDNDKGAIPRQQCSRIAPNEELGYYMLEECTHQWEYILYSMTESR